MKPKQPHGPPTTLGNMRSPGVQRLGVNEMVKLAQISLAALLN
jgi:hypothetical protein